MDIVSRETRSDFGWRGNYFNKWVIESLEEYIAFEGNSSAEISDEIVFAVNAIRDLVYLRNVLHVKHNEWIRFPILMYREFFTPDEIDACANILEEEDTLANFVPVLASLKCFNPASQKALTVNSAGTNLTRIMLEYDIDASSAFVEVAHKMIELYIMECIKTNIQKKKQSGEGEGKGEGEGANGKDENKQSTMEKSPVKDMPRDGIGSSESPESTTPVNKSIKDKMKEQIAESAKNKSGDGDADDDNDNDRKETQSKNKSSTEPDEDDSIDGATEKFMRSFFPGGPPVYHKVNDFPAPTVLYNSIDDYCMENGQPTGLDLINYAGKTEYASNIKEIYEDINKVSLRNLFMERTMAAVKSQPCRSGISMIPSRIANIFTDEKLFSPLPDEDTERPTTVSILLDGSGSMTHHLRMNTRTKNLYLSHVNAVCGVGYALFDGLAMANIDTRVFIHSTNDQSDHGNRGGTERSIVAKICDSQSTSPYSEFSKASYFDTRNNLDGYAIKKVVEQFDDGDTTPKTLIVMSDGQPAARAYDREGGIRHTRKMVEEARESGIKVWSISLSRECEESNDRIYGSDFNIKLGSLDNANEMLEELVKIVSKDALRSPNNEFTQG